MMIGAYATFVMQECFKLYSLRAGSILIIWPPFPLRSLPQPCLG